jgi:hypothetical protein
MKTLNFSSAAIAGEYQKTQVADACQRFGAMVSTEASALVQSHLQKSQEELEASADAAVQRAFATCFADIAGPAEWHASLKPKQSIVAAVVALRAHRLRYGEILPRALRQAQADAWACLASNLRSSTADLLAKCDELVHSATASAWMGNDDLPPEFRAHLEREIRSALGAVLNARHEVLERARASVAAASEAAALDRKAAGCILAKAGVQIPPAATLMTADLRAQWATAAGLSEHASHFALDTSLTSPEAARFAIVAAHEIKFLGDAVRLPALAATLIRTRQTPTAARAAMLDALAAADEALAIESGRRTRQPKPAAGSEIHVFDIYDRFNGRKQA